MSVQVPKGYKQTEVGVIPEDWEVASLQDICAFKITYGIVQCGPHIDNGVPYIRVSDMESRELNVESMLRTSHEIAKSFSRSRVELNDIVYALRGKIGEVRKVNADVVGANLTQGTARISLKKEFDSEYILWALRSSNSEDQANSESKGSTFKEITLEKLRHIQVPIPSLNEQQAIAEALSDADALIESLEQLIAKKRQIKQGAMQELLTGQRRLPGFSGEWTLKSVRELGEVITGGTPSTARADFWGGTIPWVTPTDIQDARDIFITERSLTVEGAKEIKLLPGNTVLVTCIASIGKNAILRTSGASNQQINAVIPSKESSAEFLYYLFEFNKSYLQGNAGTTATSILSKANFQELTFSIPKMIEQLAIAEFLSDIDSEISGLVSQLQKSRKIKQAMMQELLTGRIRLI